MKAFKIQYANYESWLSFKYTLVYKKKHYHFDQRSPKLMHAIKHLQLFRFIFNFYEIRSNSSLRYRVHKVL